MQICLVPLHLLPKKGKIKNGLNINGDEVFRGQVPRFCIFLKKTDNEGKS